MDNIKERMFDLKMKGYCCSQIIMQMGLDHLEKENEDLIKAMAGLCDGMYRDGTCGVLSAAICLLYLADPEEASKKAVSDLNDWFEDAFGDTECAALLGDSPVAAKAEKCPMLVETTFEMVEELLDWD